MPSRGTPGCGHFLQLHATRRCPSATATSYVIDADVLDAIVVGARDERMGESVVAFVDLRAGAGPEELDELQGHCRAAIAGYKVPRRVLFGPALRTRAGKPDYAAARALASAPVHGS